MAFLPARRRPRSLDERSRSPRRPSPRSQSVEHLVEQRRPVVEVPVEAALRDAQGSRQGLDPDRVRPALGERSQAGVDPSRARVFGRLPPTASCIRYRMYTTPYGTRRTRIGSPTASTPRCPGGSTSSPPTSGSRTSGTCRRPAGRTTSRSWSRARRGDPAASPSRARARPVGAAVEGRRAARVGRSGRGRRRRVPTLRDRLPVDLRDAPRPGVPLAPFTSLYLLDDEFAAEVANRTVHGVMHLGWVPDGAGRLSRADGV